MQKRFWVLMNPCLELSLGRPTITAKGRGGFSPHTSHVIGGREGSGLSMRTHNQYQLSFTLPSEPFMHWTGFTKYMNFITLFCDWRRRIFLGNTVRKHAFSPKIVTFWHFVHWYIFSRQTHSRTSISPNKHWHTVPQIHCFSAWPLSYRGFHWSVRTANGRATIPRKQKSVVGRALTPQECASHVLLVVLHSSALKLVNGFLLHCHSGTKCISGSECHLFLGENGCSVMTGWNVTLQPNVI
jgi:hypothetical protein